MAENLSVRAPGFVITDLSVRNEGTRPFLSSAGCQCKLHSHHFCGTSSPTNAKLLRENFPAAPSIPHQEGKSTRKQEQCLRCQEDCPPHQETPQSVAALQCYSSKTSNAKLKKKFILYIFIYIIIYINIYNMASFLECV